MKLLLDTHTFLWFIGGNQKLSGYAKELIGSPANERFLSVASLWEMSIKASLGKLRLELTFDRIISEHIDANAISLLHISAEHLDILTSLPFHHRDPFDRLIIAQGHSENIPVVSKDKAFEEYKEIQCIWEP